MAIKTFNLYCDESAHLENDHMKYMLLSHVSCAYNQVKMHTNFIKALKKKHNFYAEIKWSNLSESQYSFYKELIEYFFSTDIRFRAIIVDKERVQTGGYYADFDTFYYKMYYQLLNYDKKSDYAYNVYLDIKDDLSAYKVNKLKEILNTKYGVFRNVQNIRSHESLLLQLTDVIMGAISYNLNHSPKVNAKQKLIDRIKKLSKQNLDKTSYDDSFNMFFIELR